MLLRKMMPRSSRLAQRLCRTMHSSVSTVSEGAPKYHRELFPWKSYERLEQRVKSGFLDQIAKRIMLGFFVYRSSDDLSIWQIIPDFKQGAQMAFFQMCKSIFTSFESHGTIAEDPQTDPVDLEEIMEDKLAQFYNAAIASSKASNLTAALKYFGISSAYISDINIICGRFREEEKFKISRTRSVLSGPLLGVVSQGRELEKELDLVRSQITIQVEVTIYSRELFNVVNESTGVLQQGDQTVKRAEHRILFEGQFIDRDMHKPWYIVDIDDWMNGNLYFEVAEAEADMDED